MGANRNRCGGGQACGRSVAALEMGANLDTYRTATVLVAHNGDDVPVGPAMRAHAMLDKGDLDG